jgi:7-cyano-7-deazaguanine tRNA-ribosyltransferase
MSFQVHGKDLLGRIGTIRTKSGRFTTPHMFPVLDHTSRILSRDFFDRAGIKAVMTNAYLLRRTWQGTGPADIHEFLDYGRTVATDSGAYQILEYGEVGVKPAEIIEYQEKINTDIGVILDVPTGYHSSPERARWTVDETLRRADKALRQMSREDILWMGPVQGGVFLKEVRRSAYEMSKRDFAIYALGSPTELMETQRFDVLVDMIVTAKQELPPGKPFHLFGAGHPALFPFLVALGCDLFDSAAYALYARTGRYLTPEGTLLLGDMTEFACLCPACAGVTPLEVMRSEPADREKRLVQHNLWVCFSELARIREAIRRGRLWDLLELRAHIHPAMTKCFARIREYSNMLERSTPAVKPHGIFFYGESTDSRPESVRYSTKLLGVAADRRKLVLLLPGRWRRPFHDDPRYQSVSKAFENQERVCICFYSISYGPVPLELDETFPIAQTESVDPRESRLYKSRAEAVVKFVRTLRPRFVVLAKEGEYGQALADEIESVFSQSRFSVLNSSRMKPQSIIRTVKRRVGDLS